jgi:hypothetical protein
MEPKSEAEAGAKLENATMKPSAMAMESAMRCMARSSLIYWKGTKAVLQSRPTANFTIPCSAPTNSNRRVDQRGRIRIPDASNSSQNALTFSSDKTFGGNW